ncbi:MAG: hypothetical protein M3437_06175 [Chloroflexota bacterium]|nr:hypothetical protein [Chloroflexota bacterium]MDQ5864371.1 hypothetical protein [Chloroflexota bacterium]
MEADPGKDADTSQVFLVRLWADGAGGEEWSGATEHPGSRLHGRVMHVLSGQGSNFNDWPTLLSLLNKMMSPTLNKDETTGQEGATT